MLFRGYVQVCLEVSLGFIFGWAGAHLEISLRLAWTLKQVWGRGHLGVSLEAARGHPEVSRPLVTAACWVRKGGERVFCVVLPYITRFLSGSFLRPSPSTLPSMRCLPFSSVFFSAFNVSHGLRYFFRPTPGGSRQVVYQAGKTIAFCKFTELMQWQHQSWRQCAYKRELSRIDT